ncbi:MAG: hypothetical protein ACREKL_08555 [Chthoniobacterales bacterium]
MFLRRPFAPLGSIEAVIEAVEFYAKHLAHEQRRAGRQSVEGTVIEKTTSPEDTFLY